MRCITFDMLESIIKTGIAWTLGQDVITRINLYQYVANIGAVELSIVWKACAIMWCTTLMMFLMYRPIKLMWAPFQILWDIIGIGFVNFFVKMTHDAVLVHGFQGLDDQTVLYVKIIHVTLAVIFTTARVNRMFEQTKERIGDCHLVIKEE